MGGSLGGGEGSLGLFEEAFRLLGGLMVVEVIPQR